MWSGVWHWRQRAAAATAGWHQRSFYANHCHPNVANLTITWNYVYNRHRQSLALMFIRLWIACVWMCKHLVNAGLDIPANFSYSVMRSYSQSCFNSSLTWNIIQYLNNVMDCLWHYTRSTIIGLYRTIYKWWWKRTMLLCYVLCWLMMNNIIISVSYWRYVITQFGHGCSFRVSLFLVSRSISRSTVTLLSARTSFNNC